MPTSFWKKKRGEENDTVWPTRCRGADKCICQSKRNVLTLRMVIVTQTHIRWNADMTESFIWFVSKINVRTAIRKLSAAHFDQLLWCTLGLKVWTEAHMETYTVYVYNYQHDTSSASDCHPMLPFTRKRRRIINFEAPLSPYLAHAVSFSQALTGNPSGGFAGERRKKTKNHWALLLGKQWKIYRDWWVIVRST